MTVTYEPKDWSNLLVGQVVLLGEQIVNTVARGASVVRTIFTDVKSHLGTIAHHSEVSFTSVSGDLRPKPFNPVWKKSVASP